VASDARNGCRPGQSESIFPFRNVWLTWRPKWRSFSQRPILYIMASGTPGFDLDARVCMVASMLAELVFTFIFVMIPLSRVDRNKTRLPPEDKLNRPD
jgi:hypothetical protein